MMLYITGRFAFSNGEEITDGIRGTTINGTTYVLRNGCYIVITDKLVDSHDPGDLIKTLDNGLLDIWPICQFGGKNLKVIYREHLTSLINLNRKQKIYNDRLNSVIAKYSHLPKEVIESVKNFDHTYDYSDDGNVYRSGVAKKEEIIKQLKQYDAVNFFKEYCAAVFSYSEC